MYSIIIPLYNKANYVEKALKSVLSQTLKQFELIVINDGSTDNSFDVVSAFDLSSIDYKIINQVNAGVSTTRNNGVKLAKYPYIAFLDADDWWEPTFLEEMKALIEKFPIAGIYGSSYNTVKNGKFSPANIGVKQNFESGIINYYKIYSNTLWMPLWTGAIVIPKHVFNQMNGFNSELKIGEDFHLWVRITDIYDVAFLNKQLSNYNQDVDINTSLSRIKIFKSEEHMLFSDYSNLNHPDFKYLFQKLAIIGLFPCYIYNQHVELVNKILSNIVWKNYSLKYYIYYRILPKKISSFSISLINLIFETKNRFIVFLNFKKNKI